MMASFSFSTLPTTTTTKKTTTSPPLFSKTASRRSKVSCNAANSNNDNRKTSETPKLILPGTPSFDMQNVDRRNVLLGLGGLYGAANLTNIRSALAYPVTTPDDISQCIAATDGVSDPANALRGTACCPPSSATAPKPYVLPEFSTLRMRPAAQKATPEYIAKYQAAIAAMKALPDDHPHSWKQQGKIHCAYCNGAYNQAMNGHPEIKIQVHNNWLFFPFHRWYLYFYERILGKLINDPTFALPYWNWDNPTGMMMPAMFEAPYGLSNNPRENPIFDPYRNVAHLPPTVLDLQYRGTESGAACIDQVSVNLSTVYNQMITGSPDADTFFGTDPNVDGTLAGSIERGAHTAMHIWVGNPRMPNREDMGNFYSAGYDPLFYVHHSNVDRMWKIWKDMDPIHQEPSSDDWKNASYVFYDENEELVRVYNKDCLDIKKMGYDFERSQLPWLQGRPTPRVKASNVAALSVGTVKKAEETQFPVKLDEVVKILVKRPAKSRSKSDKKKANEMLFLNGIQFNSEVFFKFDVLVDDVDDGIETTAASSEFAGTFAQVPHMHDSDMLMTSGAAFGIGELLEDLEAEDDEYVLVTLVPRAGTENASVSEIKIQLVPI